MSMKEAIKECKTQKNVLKREYGETLNTRYKRVLTNI